MYSPLYHLPLPRCLAGSNLHRITVARSNEGGGGLLGSVPERVDGKEEEGEREGERERKSL